jgi:hypothetical protein
VGFVSGHSLKLTTSRDKVLFSEIKMKALPALLQMAKCKGVGHAEIITAFLFGESKCLLRSHDWKTAVKGLIQDQAGDGKS